MNVIDISCQDSYNFSKSCYHINNEKKLLFLGKNKSIYLFFNLPYFLPADTLLNARLLLFRLFCLPLDTKSVTLTENAVNQYKLYPLLDFSSIFSDLLQMPAVDLNRGINFQSGYNNTYTEIDITQIVTDWLNNSLENKGILLRGTKLSSCITYASNQYAVLGMRPAIRITCKKLNICRSLQKAPCEVTISSNAL